MKQMKPFAGTWRIVEMEVWGQDYVDMEVPGDIRIGSDGTGLVSGDIDSRVEPCGDTPRFEFSWSWQEEHDPRWKPNRRPNWLIRRGITAPCSSGG